MKRLYFSGGFKKPRKRSFPSTRINRRSVAIQSLLGLVNLNWFFDRISHILMTSSLKQDERFRLLLTETAVYHFIMINLCVAASISWNTWFFFGEHECCTCNIPSTGTVKIRSFQCWCILRSIGWSCYADMAHGYGWSDLLYVDKICTVITSFILLRRYDDESRTSVSV